VPVETEETVPVPTAAAVEMAGSAFYLRQPGLFSPIPEQSAAVKAALAAQAITRQITRLARIPWAVPAWSELD
jgi:hypothetical protein